MKKEYDVIRDRKYYEQLNYEAALTGQINRIARFRSESMLKDYINGVETLRMMLPSDMRTKVAKYKQKNGITNPNGGISHDLVQKYDELWMYCNELLEKGDLIFKIGKGASEYGTM